MSIPKSGISRQIALLNRISVGPAAIKLPTTAVSMDLQFFERQATKQALQETGEITGPRKFWKDYLPQIQFYNPHLAISVREFREKDHLKAGRKAFVKLVHQDGSTKQIDAGDRSSEDILEDVIKEFGAQKIDASEQKQVKLPNQESYI